MQIVESCLVHVGGMKLRASRYAGVMVLMLGMVGVAWSQPMQPYQEYDKRLRTAEQVGALTSNLFGDAVNVYDQSTTFNQTDIDLPGTNALPVRLSRSLSIRPIPAYGIAPKVYAGAGDWSIDVPYISGVFDSAYRWNVTDTGATPRCSSAFYPRTQLPNKLEDVWSGYNVNLPGQGARSLVAMPPEEFKRPDGQSHIWTTTALDSITCTSMAGGYPGEGFVLQTTDGVTYTFNIATERAMGAMARDSGGAGRQRVEIFLLASRIQDRFGNYVDISYNSNGHPVAFTGSDGRTIGLAYSGDRLVSASANGRTWSYAYNGDTLQKVTQPDQGVWEFAHLEDRRIDYYQWKEDIGVGCGNVAPLRDKMYRLQMRHPSGAVGTFRFDHQRLSRSGVPGILCQPESTGGNVEVGFPVVHYTPVPAWFDVLGLTEKTIDGPGLVAPLRWLYTDLGGYYQPWSGNVPPCLTCVQSKVVRITQPDGSRIEETYGVVYSFNEGKMLARSTVAADGATLESEALTYVSDAQASALPFPSRYGSRWGGSDESSVLVRPLAKKVIVRDGTTLTWEALTFDAKARPLKVTRGSTLGYSRTDTTAYHDHASAWVLGQTASVTNNDTGLVEVQTTFNGQALPVEQRQFGRLVQTLSYHPDGAVAGFSDGRGNTTLLTNWKRGTPQSVVFADGNGLSASVDDNGWIRSVSNELGYQTSYGYDAMGRMTSKTFASGDATAWNSSTQVFERVDANEHGIAPGHWRLSSSMGNYRKTTWFDAMWRPMITREYDATAVAATDRYQRFSYDYAGRGTFQSYPGATASLSAGQWTEYDALGRTTSQSIDSELGLLATVTEYLPGLRTRVTNPRGQQTLTSHQAFDAPSYDSPTLISHPEAAFTEIARDRFGKPVSIKRRNADGSVAVTRSYVYNPKQQLCKSVEPESGATVMAYDEAGNLAWSAAGLALTAANGCETSAAQASGRRIDRSYDSRNRLSHLVFPDGNGTQSWSYNALGKPSQVVTENSGDRQVINTYTYNKRGLIAAETMQQQGVGIWTLGYGYDANAALSQLLYPSGELIAFAPNALGQPTRAGSHATAVRYYPSGALRSFTYGNGITHAMTQNARMLPARVIDAGVLDATNTYDANGNVLSTSDAVVPGKSRQMQYDALDRLTQATSAAFGGDGTFRYTYDVLDNIRSAKLGSVKQHNYYYDARNRLTTVNRDDGAAIIGLDYDVQGNLAKKNGEVFRFDYGNRLRDGAGRELYAYDAHGRRVGSYSSAQGDILSFYGHDGVLRRQHNKRDGKEIEYVSLGGSVVAELISLVQLGVPTLTAPATVGVGNYTVSWTPVSSATSYQLRFSVNGGTSWSSAYAGPATSHPITGAPTGARTYQARACQGTHCGNWSSTLVVQVTPVPAAPPVLQVPTAGLNGSYSISWTAITGAARYAIEERKGNGAWSSVHNAATLSVALTGRAAGEYRYRGQACNVSGCSSWSPEQVVTVIHPSDSAPSVTSPASSSTGSFTVSWSAVTGTTRYEPQERLGSGAWSSLASTPSTALSVSGKATGNYGYQVRACNSAGCSPWSNTVSTAVLLPPAAAPAITLASASTTGSYTVSWSPVGGAVAYRLEEREGTGSWNLVQNESATLRAVSGKGNGTYAYRVQACNSSGCSNLSAEKAVSVLRVPGGMSITVPATNNSGAWAVSWSAVGTASSYQLEEQVNGGAWASVYTGSALSWSTSGRGTGSHGYRGRACNASGCGAYSSVVTTAVTLPPSAAPSLSVPSSSGTGSFTVSWAAVATSTRYELEEQVGSAWTTQQSTSAMSKAFSGRATGSFRFRVRACNTGGCGAYSGTATVTVLLVPQSAPAITAPASAPAAYTVSWSTVATATRYDVQQKVNGGGWGALGSYGGTSVGLNPGSSGSYAYRVQACNATGCGAWSSSATVAVRRAPPAPTMSYANQHDYYAGPNNAQYSSCQVGWTAVGDADRYELHAHGGSMLYNGADTSVAGQSYSIQYCASVYVVRACNIAGCSPFSAPMNHTLTQDPYPGDGGGVIP